MKKNKHFKFIFFALIFNVVLCISSKAQDITCSIQACIDYTGPSYSGTVNSINLSGTLTNLTPLSGITSVTGNLIISNSSTLTNLNGLGNITSVGGNLEIHDMGALTNLAGLEGLTSVGGYIFIGSNAALTSLSGLSSLTSFDELFIMQNTSITNLSGLENLTSVSGSITIQNNPSITILSGLDNLTSVVGNLTIAWNDALINTTGLESLTSVGGNIFIASNYVMTTLEGLESLTSVSGKIDIQHNNSLTNVDGLAGLSEVGGNFYFSNCDSLANLDGLENLLSIGGELIIAENPMLISFCGLYPLFTSGTFGYVSLSDNGILFPYGPDTPTQVEQVIALGPCTPNVTLVFIDLYPGTCPNLLNVRARGFIPAAILGTADFDVETIDPETLQLDGVSPVRWSIKDVATPVVNGEDCDCTIQGPDGYVDLNLKFNTQELVAALGEVNDGDEIILTMTGETTDGIPFEGSDCVVILAKNLGKELSENMSNVPDEYALFENYPNPFNPSTKIQFAIPDGFNGMTTLKVYNVLGKEVATLVNETKEPGIYEAEFNAANLPSGIYFYKLTSGNFSETKKMMLLK